jgi:endonuclease/exonuclease/phosphatase family metal-dependent hydrolase
LRVLSYNIWFEKISETRINALLSVIEDADADIVCLQEVTPTTQAMLLQNKFIYDTYCTNGTFSGNKFKAFYGVMIFSKVPAAFYELDFEATMMGRSLIVCEPLDPVLPVVATAHFESLDSA